MHTHTGREPNEYARAQIQNPAQPKSQKKKCPKMAPNAQTNKCQMRAARARKCKYAQEMRAAGTASQKEYSTRNAQMRKCARAASTRGRARGRARGNTARARECAEMRAPNTHSTPARECTGEKRKFTSNEMQIYRIRKYGTANARGHAKKKRHGAQKKTGRARNAHAHSQPNPGGMNWRNI